MIILKSKQQLNKEIKFYQITSLTMLILFFIYTVLNKITLMLYFGIIYLFLFQTLKQLTNRQHNNIQYEELNYQINEIRKDIKILRFNKK